MIPSLLLDNFDFGLRNPYQNEAGKELWMFYGADFTEPGDRGHVEVMPAAAKCGRNGLRATVESGNLYLYFYPYEEKFNVWHYLAEIPKKGVFTHWKPQAFNRLAYWVRTPPDLKQRTDGGFNWHTSWFTRDTKTPLSANESYPGKWYGYSNVQANCWSFVTVDLCHPHHLRGAETQEWGVRQTPSGDPGAWMADLLTAFYVDAKGTLDRYPATYDFDSFILQAIAPDDPVSEIYNLTAGYNLESHRYYLSWSKRRDVEGQRFDVYVSTRPFRRRPNEKQRIAEGITGLGSGGYNGCLWQGEIPIKPRHRFLYFAIQKQGDDRHRQIYLTI